MNIWPDGSYIEGLIVFVRICYFLGVLIFFGSALMLAVSIGFAVWGEPGAFESYFPGRSTGKMIDQNLYGILVGSALGAIGEIGRKLD